ncbi:cytokinin hydroxylase-like isoform X2 [Silene latifolia]|uniref:cytokinin hydroxylase-like isoform X2 n=1 Tax=Silene latifolia TaxID=37657 RepID=UPI003D776FA5
MLLVIITAFIIIFSSWFAKLSYETISFYWLNPRRIKKIMEKQGVHGPKPRPLLGNLLDVATLVASSASMDMPTITHDIVSRLIPHHLLWSRKYGKRYIYWHGVEPRMCLSDPDLIKELLTRYNHVTGKTWLQQQGSKHFLGRGLLMANGDSWYHQRHIVSPAFMSDKLKGYAAEVVECTTSILKSVQNAIQRGKHEVEIGELMTRLTTDIISKFEFGRDHEKGKKIFNLLVLLRLRCAQSSKHLYIPGVRFFPSKCNKEIKTLKKEVEERLMEIIESRKRCVEMGRSDSSDENDLIGILVNELHKNDSNGFSSMQLIMDECKTFLIAGHETTALLLTWTLMLLATNLDWQQKLRDEITQVCNGATPSFDHLPKLRLASKCAPSPFLK